MKKTEELKPELNINVSKGERIFEVIIIAFLVGFSIFSLKNYVILGDTIPIHFNFKGEPDNFGPKGIFLLLLTLKWLITLGLLFLTRKPHLYNYPIKVTETNYEKLYKIASKFMRNLSFYVVYLFSTIEIYVVHSAMGKCVMNIPKFLTLGIVLILLNLVYFIFKMQKNK